MATEKQIAMAPDYSVRKDGSVVSHKTDKKRVLVPFLSSANILVVTLVMNGHARPVAVHRLVADAYLKPGEGRFIRHKDNDPSNCAADNLYRTNLSHGVLTVTPIEQPKTKQVRLTFNQRMAAAWMTVTEVERAFGVSQASAYRVAGKGQKEAK